MAKVLTCCSRLQIKADDLEHDIAAFIQSQIDTYSQNDLLGCPSSALDLIKQKLVSDAEGNVGHDLLTFKLCICVRAEFCNRFLWADLQFKAILDACEEDGTPDRSPDFSRHSLLLRRVTDRKSEKGVSMGNLW